MKMFFVAALRGVGILRLVLRARHQYAEDTSLTRSNLHDLSVTVVDMHGSSFLMAVSRPGGPCIYLVAVKELWRH